METLQSELVRKAVDGHQASIRSLIVHLTPVIQQAIASTLANGYASYHGLDIKEDTADFCQEILCLLFHNDSKLLRSWDPKKGMKLESFVSMVAKRRVISTMRSVKPTSSLDNDESSLCNVELQSTENFEKRTLDNQLLTTLLERLKADISEFGYRIFIELFLYENSPDEIERNLGIKKNSIYVWRNRLRCRAAEIVNTLESH